MWGLLVIAVLLIVLAGLAAIHQRKLSRGGFLTTKSELNSQRARLPARDDDGVGGVRGSIGIGG
jgi:hypothetical protein